MAEGSAAGRVVVAGTGKMAFNLGLLFLARGARVAWLSRSAGRAAGARAELDRLLRRMARVDPGFDGAGRATLGWLAENGHGIAGMVPEESIDLVIECSAEDMPAKQLWGRALAGLGDDGSLRLTNSSSIMPGVLGPDWLGCHFFYPVELHRFAELILPAAPTARLAANAEAARSLLDSLGFRCLRQDDRTAFAVNRLLLPLQNLAMECLRAGWPAAVVDEASASPCLPVRILGGMDAIGLDVIRESVVNYLAGPEAPRASGLAGLAAGLDELLACGKRGVKNRNGLLIGDPLPWTEQAGGAGAGPAGELAGRFAALAAASCRQALERRDFSQDELAFVLDDLWGGRLP